METKIPPPIVTLIFGLAIYLSRTIFPEIEIQYSSFFGMILLLLGFFTVSYTHLRAHETKANLVCRLLLEKKKNN